MDWRPLALLCLIGVIHAQKPQLRPLSAQTEPVTKSQNESYVVTCIANSSDKAVWTGPRGELPVGSGRVHVEDRGTHGVVLLFDRIEVSDKGNYTCKANNEQVSFSLTVNKVLLLKNTNLEQKVREFQSGVVKCEVEGEPKPMITWKKNGISVKEISNRLVPDTMGLKILNASKSDSGVYTCSAMQISSGASSIYSWDITLRVQHKPEWKEPGGDPVKTFGYVTGETNLTCEAVAEPPANYSWSRVNHSSKNLPHNSTELRGAGRSVLKIYVTNESYGSYKCEASNHLGRISRVFDLSPGEKPKPPAGLRAPDGGMTEHTATIKVASDIADADLVGFRVQFVITRPGEEAKWDRADFQDVAKNSKGHYLIVDLLEDTPYMMRVATRSVAGLSDYSTDTVSLRTTKQKISSSSRRVEWELFAVFLSAVILAAVH